MNRCLVAGAALGWCAVIARVAYLRGGPLADAGFVDYVLVFYVVALAVETGLWVRHG